MPVALICKTCGIKYKRSPSAALKSNFCSNTCRAVMSAEKFTKDLLGKKFGRWTVIRKSQRRTAKGGLYWFCKCECGTEHEVQANGLMNGTSSSCGCRLDEMRPNIAKTNFTKPISSGTRFGRFIVLERQGYKRDSVAYLCECDCGVKKIMPSDSLRRDDIVSCGCYSIEKLIERSTTHGMTHDPNYKRWRHRQRKLLDRKWTLDMELSLRKMFPVCVICGSDEQLATDHVRPLSKGNGLEPGNAVILCKSCNSIKHNRDLSDLPTGWQIAIEQAAMMFATSIECK